MTIICEKTINPDAKTAAEDFKATRPPTVSDAEKFLADTFGSTCPAMPDCFLTGSVAFGEATTESDIDLAFPIMSRGAVEGVLLSAKISTTASDYNGGSHAVVRIGDEEFRVNFLFLHPLDYVVWRRAGVIYKSLPRQTGRENRHALFQTICACVKTAFAMSGVFVTTKNYKEFL